MASDAGRQSVVGVDDVDVKQVWETLAGDPSAVLVDVRTRAEWTYVGLPDLAAVGKRPILAEWQTFPDNRVDPQFADKLASTLQTAGVNPGSHIFFICRSGGRSKAAAVALAGKGFDHCHNVADGFEGPLDPDQHRGRTGGWKSSGLPWVQG